MSQCAFRSQRTTCVYCQVRFVSVKKIRCCRWTNVSNKLVLLRWWKTCYQIMSKKRNIISHYSPRSEIHNCIYIFFLSNWILYTGISRITPLTLYQAQISMIVLFHKNKGMLSSAKSCLTLGDRVMSLTFNSMYLDPKLSRWKVWFYYFRKHCNGSYG